MSKERTSKSGTGRSRTGKTGGGSRSGHDRSGNNRSGAGKNAKRRGGSFHKGRGDDGSSVLLYGIHSVEAALLNPARDVLALWVSKNASQRLEAAIAQRDSISAQSASPQELDGLVGPDAVHQGAVLKARPLPEPSLEDLSDHGLVLVLDQVTDPHNVGAILRSAAVFGASALIMTERNSPALSGVLAKTASGGLEHVPVVLVTNLARALGTLGDRGFQRIGLDGEGEVEISEELKSGGTVLVLGAEGKGLRRLTRENCDILCRIPTGRSMDSLNVSNAAAVALYALREE